MVETKDIIEIIHRIKNKPELYIGKKDIFCLLAYFQGILQHVTALENEDILRKFQVWIENRFNQKNSQSWASIIHFYSFDEHRAVDQFFRLFDIFLEEAMG